MGPCCSSCNKILSFQGHVIVRVTKYEINIISTSFLVVIHTNISRYVTRINKTFVRYKNQQKIRKLQELTKHSHVLRINKTFVRYKN